MTTAQMKAANGWDGINALEMFDTTLKSYM